MVGWDNRSENAPAASAAQKEIPIERSDYSVVNKIIRHLKLSFKAERITSTSFSNLTLSGR